ncbi:hypothetical protein CC85DRAFT_285331 [Cutaneotrichosporon oleaginosum]|uniref:Uncharacterized protein n=1 Tax=Cutaneotrichosporon oleaginosum TaxID=879819 RepID=A0A0J0XNE2_9TREE|nr:uncharacterized protein CC85DRAFT_285331 [Cutaneotrichosporon oleaginosum]KLT42597.1 hypothetical protein CC85DRAFT_285331 [Cutaneotrichosporon oleaginosum]TXT05286.1 hypothetical protein COLE_06606 [Cutaneotrichosporon oleaginosum]
MHGNRYRSPANNPASTKKTPPSKQGGPALSGPSHSPHDKDVGADVGTFARSRNRPRNRRRKGGRLQDENQKGPIPGSQRHHEVQLHRESEAKSSERPSWEEVFARMADEAELELSADDPADGWGEPPKSKLRRLRVEKWLLGVVPGAAPF